MNRSENMRRIKSKNTSIELKLRKEVLNIEKTVKMYLEDLTYALRKVL